MTPASQNVLPPTRPAKPAPLEQMMQMATGYWVTQIVYGAARFGLADHVQGRELTAEAFAQAEGLDGQAAHRFLRACASLGLVDYNGQGGFTGTALLDTLRRDHPQSMRGMALSMGARGHWLPWGRFADALQSGAPQTSAALGAELFDYLAQAPAEGKAFSDAMAGLTATVSDAVARCLDARAATRVVDVGGAGGSLLFPLLRANPSLRGVVFDLPNVAPAALASAVAAGLADRVDAIGGDFFQSVPEGDLLLLKYVLHDWDDAECVTILRNCRRALRPGGRVAVVELLLGDIGSTGLAPLMDLNMMVLVSGRERTLDEYRALFAQAGLGNVRVIGTGTPMVILEAFALSPVLVD